PHRRTPPPPPPPPPRTTPGTACCRLRAGRRRFDGCSHAIWLEKDTFMTSHTVQIKLNGSPLSLGTSKVAKQADGAVVVRFGGTMVLSTVVAARGPMEGRDFLPLTAEYREKAYAGGKTPGGFFKHQGRPDEKGTVARRSMAHPNRPLLPTACPHKIQLRRLVVAPQSAT